MATDEHTSPSLSQAKLAEMDLEKDCEDMWTHINQVHKRVNKEPPLGAIGDAENSLSILQAEEKHLKGELHTLNSTQLQTLPTNPTILKALLRKELMTVNTQLEQTLHAVQAQRRELEAEVEREKSLLEEYRKTREILESKVEAASEDEIDSASQVRNTKEKEQRQKKSASEQHQKLMRSLAEFVNKNFSKPTDKPKQTSGRTKEYMSLLKILEVLMNKCTDSDSDPYVMVDDACWPPYIELLLRCGIALRHPQDVKRIRLVPFHL